ncbi:hypothetical protein DPMN_079221 [Dreissena polymorpha]|uniref:Uncharacterized protein n=1 Tax=Dreissena polymorpha TaxID=45954 RepID=A0A9D3YSQ2_DREPO|nr:hypothetical protein DPMN_079221 [Dreissena polymorpha]
MARQRPTRLVMGPCIVEIDRIVIREVQYQLQVNRCRNEEIIVKGKFGWTWPMRPGRPRIDRIVIREAQYQFEVNRCRNEEVIFQGSSANRRTDGRTDAHTTISQLFLRKTITTLENKEITRNGASEADAGAPGLVMGPCIVEIDRIVIREVQYQLEVNRCTGRPRINRIVIREVQYQFEVNRCRNEELIVKGNFGWAWPMWAGRLRVGNGAMHMNRCRNEEIIVKGNFGWAWPMWAGRPRIDCIVIREVQYQFEVNRCTGRPRINRIVIREVQYQFEVNRCRNEELIVKGNFGWAWPMWAGRLRIDHIVIREVQNEEIIVKSNFGWAWSMWAGYPRVVNGAMHKVQYQFEDNRCRNEEIKVK